MGLGGRLSPRKPSLEDIDQSRLQIFRPSMWGGTLQETLNIQKEKFPARRLPWILTTLTDQILGMYKIRANMQTVLNLISKVLFLNLGINGHDVRSDPFWWQNK